MGKIRGARCHAAVHRAGHRGTRNAHIHRDNRAVRRRGHAADAGAAQRQVFEHGAGHGGIGLADALRHHAVVRAEHQHGAAGEVRRRVAHQGGGVLHHRFQPAQPAQRLCQRRPVGVRGGAGRFVSGGHGFEQIFELLFGHSSSLL